MVPGVVKDFVRSEKAVFSFLLIIAATVLVGLERMSIEQWTSYTKWIAAFYIGGKTAQGVAQVLKGPGSSKPKSETASGELGP